MASIRVQLIWNLRSEKVRLLFKCGFYSSAASIQVRLLFKCGFYTQLYGTWPANSDIWLGIRTVPVLSVAKESRGASQIAHWPRSAQTQAGRCGLTDWRSSVKKLLSFVRLLMFPSLLEEITGHGMPVECSKLTCFAKVKIRHGSRAVRSTIEVGRCQSSFAYCEAEFDLGKGKNRSEATYPHWKDENNNHHWQTNPNSHVCESESQSEVDVRWPAMYCGVDPAPVHNYGIGSSAGRRSADLLAVWGPSAGLKHSVATSSG